MSKTKKYITILLQKYQIKKSYILKISNKVKSIDIKSQTYYFYNDTIITKNFDLNDIKIDEKSYKNICIYYIGYVTIEDSKFVKLIV